VVLPKTRLVGQVDFGNTSTTLIYALQKNLPNQAVYVKSQYSTRLSCVMLFIVATSFRFRVCQQCRHHLMTLLCGLAFLPQAVSHCTLLFIN